MNINDLKFIGKLKQKKYRDSGKLFIIEGKHIIEECLNSEYFSDKLQKIILRNDFDDKIFLEKIIKFSPEILNGKDFIKLTDTVNSQGIIGIVKMPEQSQFETKKFQSKVIVALDNINDPGNLGTILRTCYWFGVNEIIISENSVDIYNSKTIRASQGAIFNVNIYCDVNLSFELEYYRKSGYEILFTKLDSDIFLNENIFSKEKKYVFVFGNEANGISGNLKKSVMHTGIKIKSYSKCESLNLGTSVGIVLYEMNKAMDLKLQD